MQFRQATPEDVYQVATLLTESFIDYPLFSVIEKNRDNRYSFLYELQYINTMTFIRKYSCLVITERDKIVGAALLKPLQGKQSDLLEYVRMGSLRLIKKRMLFKAIRFLKLANRFDNSTQDGDYFDWYLDSLAISKLAQGQGIGSQFLNQCIFQYISENGGGVLSLVTNTELNRKFYKKNGFEEFKEEHLQWQKETVRNWSYYIKCL